MGANNVIPTVPTFVAGAPSLTDLNNLAYAASFLIDHGTRPTWKFIASSVAGTVTAATWTVVPFNDMIYDSDGTWTSGSSGATIVTQGYYRLEAGVQVEELATRVNFATAFKWTAGIHSPYSAQSPYWFGHRGISMSITGTATASQAGCNADITPFAMYPGDLLQVMVFIGGATNAILEANDNGGGANYMLGRMSMQFTGRWAREGS
jgi:hypothetical protein